ncbi:MAG: 2-hydroxyglutaryl-CoA dehydratase [Labilithrix sp.]|nr:2-hydroxyglutaryl-CoA dehydratase [Labilithrix sp.]MCW5812338.1 2-hydroxyglutaryl-CoA dehydratase [Labilithrix sp.]
MNDTTFNGINGKKSLKIAGQDLDLDAEIAKFEAEERKRLGLDQKTEQWLDDMVDLQFTRKERDNVTLLIGGLTLAHDYLIEGGLKGVGYNVQMLNVPDTAAFQAGKEFGNRGQCNPTYFTVGNLVQYLIKLRDKGMSSEEIVKNYAFLTAGACGPCRFGMYVTEYRKALRDAGFDGFRVLLFQQTGGIKQATGDELGLELNGTFFWAILKGMFVGDVLNAYGYRVRPYEKVKGDANKKIQECKDLLYKALEDKTNILVALSKCKPILRSIEVDKTMVKPKVSIIGEFWAMTTEGDGNYQLQEFLEAEGAECDIQLVAAWMLYMLWEVRNDTADRADLREWDTAKYGLGGGGPFQVFQKLAISHLGDKAVKGIFQVFAHMVGLYGYKFASMEEVAEVAHDYYNNDLRGGEGHMEVGKLIVNVLHQKCHMTLSVKPFGCMPSAGVSDGVQTAITEKFPGTIFCPVETSGDGRVNFYSRVQMYLFKAKQAAQAEYERALTEQGVTREQVAAFLDANPKFRSPFYKAKHVYCGNNADIVAAVAPYILKTRTQRWKDRLANAVTGTKKVVQETPHLAVSLVEGVKQAPAFAERLKEDITIVREIRALKKQQKKNPVDTLDAAAEE